MTQPFNISVLQVKYAKRNEQDLARSIAERGLFTMIGVRPMGLRGAAAPLEFVKLPFSGKQIRYMHKTLCKAV